jgi:hypothetical protein
VSDDTALTEFFLKVAEDHDLFERYKKDPEQVLKRFGVSSEVAEAIAHEDLAALRRLILKPSHPGIVCLVVVRRPT